MSTDLTEHIVISRNGYMLFRYLRVHTQLMLEMKGRNLGELIFFFSVPAWKDALARFAFAKPTLKTCPHYSRIRCGVVNRLSVRIRVYSSVPSPLSSNTIKLCYAVASRQDEDTQEINYVRSLAARSAPSDLPDSISPLHRSFPSWPLFLLRARQRSALFLRFSLSRAVL